MENCLMNRGFAGCRRCSGVPSHPPIHPPSDLVLKSTPGSNQPHACSWHFLTSIRWLAYDFSEYPKPSINWFREIQNWNHWNSLLFVEMKLRIILVENAFVDMKWAQSCWSLTTFTMGKWNVIIEHSLPAFYRMVCCELFSVLKPQILIFLFFYRKLLP